MPPGHLWEPNALAIWAENAPGTTRAITLRHPTYPYQETIGNLGAVSAVASRYLDRIRGRLDLPPLFSSPGVFTTTLAWLKVDGSPPQPNPEPEEPHASFWVRRFEANTLVDQTVVLIAPQTGSANQEDQAIGSRLGIRVVAHVEPVPSTTDWTVRITGATCSTRLKEALVTYSQPVQDFFNQFFSLPNFRTDFVSWLFGQVRINQNAQLRINGFRVLGGDATTGILETYLHESWSPDDPNGVASTWTVAFAVKGPINTGGLTVIRRERCPLVAHAVDADLFPRDPASQHPRAKIVEARPSRSPKKLDDFRTTEVGIPGLTQDNAGNIKLNDPPRNEVKVTRSTLVDKPPTDDEIQIVKLPDVDPLKGRTNAFAAMSGYRNARRLFDTMRSYGLSPNSYFRFAKLPLRVRHRATIIPGPGKNGKTVNAQVDYFPADCHLVVDWIPGSVKPLQVRFALADLRRSTSRRQPLGLATDRRWSWHEYGHVLLAAATGALELHFAHSVGDALAAITSDPDSDLVTRPGMLDELRGATFPWVYLNRRHDRSVFHGWSWCGRFHRPLRFPAVRSNCQQKGYESEQILSTSLFRLYRALGGDTVKTDPMTGKLVPDRPARLRAADYTVYLIMRAIPLLGPAVWAVAETPDQLVSALIHADEATQPLPAPTPVPPRPLEDRVGGWAHKVVRWAFEAQGLYATNDPNTVIDAPGLPPLVDVFIDDNRPDSESSIRRGGYVPVSLHSEPAPNLSVWHALKNGARDAMQVVGNQVTVEVENCGQADAMTTVEVWWADWQDPLPKWKAPGKWNSLGVTAAKLVPAWSPLNAPTPFTVTGIPTTPPGKRILILAAASAAADLPNTEPATGLPCANKQTPLVDLVAGDNNLGLRLHVVP